nr:transporter associated domain-containing protein [Paracoccus saliphilus]
MVMQRTNPASWNEDGSLLIAGWMAADEFTERIGINLEPDRDYNTVAGLVIDRRGSLPQVGEHVLFTGRRIEVVDLTGAGSTSFWSSAAGRRDVRRIYFFRHGRGCLLASS